LNEQLPGRSTVLVIEAHGELAAAGLAKVKAPAAEFLDKRTAGIQAHSFL
jgi:hypothetical protein